MGRRSLIEKHEKVQIPSAVIFKKNIEIESTILRRFLQDNKQMLLILKLCTE